MYCALRNMRKSSVVDQTISSHFRALKKYIPEPTEVIKSDSGGVSGEDNASKLARVDGQPMDTVNDDLPLVNVGPVPVWGDNIKMSIKNPFFPLDANDMLQGIYTGYVVGSNVPNGTGTFSYNEEDQDDTQLFAGLQQTIFAVDLAPMGVDFEQQSVQLNGVWHYGTLSRASCTITAGTAVIQSSLDWSNAPDIYVRSCSISISLDKPTAARQLILDWAPMSTSGKLNTDGTVSAFNSLLNLKIEDGNTSSEFATIDCGITHGKWEAQGELYFDKRKTVSGLSEENKVVVNTLCGIPVFTCCSDTPELNIISYRGNFARGVANGPDAAFTLSDSMNEIQYKGSFKNGKQHGSGGTTTYPNGWTFTGSFENGKRSGKGVLTSTADGVTWTGKWEDDKRTDEMGVYTNGGVSQTGWWPDGKSFESTTSRSREEADNNLAISSLLTSPIVVQKPQYDIPLPRDGDVVLKRSPPETAYALKKLFSSTNGRELMKGADPDKYMKSGEFYTRLEPIACFDIDYSKHPIQRLWQRAQSNHFDRMAYCVSGDNPEKTRFQDSKDGQFKPPPKYDPGNKLFVKTRTDRLPGLTADTMELDKQINEKFLLHGTRPEFVAGMLDGGPQIKHAKRGLFGSALYFSDDVGKSDQYCRLSDMDKDANGKVKQMLGIKPEDYADAAVSKHGKRDVFYMFVARIALGCPAHVTNINEFKDNKISGGTTNIFYVPFGSMFDPGSAQNLDRQFQSVVVENGGNNTGLRYREFMVYKDMCVKLSHLVVFKRMPGNPSTLPSSYKDELDRSVNGFVSIPKPDDLSPMEVLCCMDKDNLSKFFVSSKPPPAALPSAPIAGTAGPSGTAHATFPNGSPPFRHYSTNQAAGTKLEWKVEKFQTFPTGGGGYYENFLITLVGSAKKLENLNAGGIWHGVTYKMIIKLREMVKKDFMTQYDKRHGYLAKVELVLRIRTFTWNSFFTNTLQWHKKMTSLITDDDKVGSKAAVALLGKATLMVYIDRFKVTDNLAESLKYGSPPSRILAMRKEFHQAVKYAVKLFHQNGLVLGPATTEAEIDAIVVV